MWPLNDKCILSLYFSILPVVLLSYISLTILYTSITSPRALRYAANYGETEFSKLLSKKAGLTILSVNIQCINTNFDDFESFINRMKLTNSISVICLQDCWLKETDNSSMFNLTNYTLVSLLRSCCGHGGLMISVHNQFKCTPINNKTMKKATDWEYLCVEKSLQQLF